MELNHLRCFYEVAKSGSFTKAALRLHISQSALSKAVALLEQAEGVRLFERSKTGVTLTALGAEVFQRSEEIFKTVQEIENACRGKKETIEGPLRFGASDHVTNYLLVETVHEIRESYPDLIPSISSSAPNDIIARLLTNEIEFGLFFTQVNVPQIIYEDLFSIEMAVVTSGKNAKDLKKEMSPADLRSFIQKQGFITSIQTHYQNSPSEELLKLVGESSQIIFECNSQEAQKRFCLQGKGVAFLAKFMVEDELKSGKLVALPLKKSIILNLYLARGRGRSTSAGARAFLDLLKTRYKLSK